MPRDQEGAFSSRLRSKGPNGRPGIVNVFGTFSAAIDRVAVDGVELDDEGPRLLQRTYPVENGTVTERAELWFHPRHPVQLQVKDCP